LKSDNDSQSIRDRDAHSREMGVGSVPTFIIANQHAVPGAQSPEMWTKVIGEIMEQLEQEPVQS
ncbi:MAG: DsbA family oxidoreductase, partial [Paracoccaceae bacterium]